MKKAIIEFDLNKISDDVLNKKAKDDSVSLPEFQKEIKKHNKIKRSHPKGN